LWRRALNGFNDNADPKELDDDLQQCVVDFKQAWARDPGLVDAKGGAASCMVNNSFLIMGSDRARARQLFQDSTALLNEALAGAPDNPRLLWVQGTNAFYSRESGAQERAIATYERALALARKQEAGAADALDPTWGEPELLMNLAFANLHKSSPDLDAATGYAESALVLVPYWHYVRDILLAQIENARTAASSTREKSHDVH
jgi:tetratricopeptide (TPR) repeat protein